MKNCLIYFYHAVFILLCCLIASCSDDDTKQESPNRTQSLDEMLDSVSKITGTIESDSVSDIKEDIFRDAILSTIDLLDEEGFVITGDSVASNADTKNRLNQFFSDNLHENIDTIIFKVKNIRQSVFLSKTFSPNKTRKLIFEEWALNDFAATEIITALLEQKYKGIMKKFPLRYYAENDTIYLLTSNTDISQTLTDKIWFAFLDNLGINIAETE